MKIAKILMSLAVALSLVSLVAVRTVSAQTFHLGVVTGLVTDGGNPVNGASVTVVCAHTGGDQTLTTTTDASGVYLVEYPGTTCVDGDNVTVTATKGSRSGSNNGTMDAVGTILDIAIVNVPLVPEFGLITGAVALLGSSGAFLVLKKKRT